MPDLNLNSVAQAAADTIVAEVNKLIDGANGDIQAFAIGIATDTVQAAAAGRTDLLEMLKDQTAMLLETNRLRAVAGAENIIMDVVRVALSVAVKIVIPTIPTLSL